MKDKDSFIHSDSGLTVVIIINNYVLGTPPRTMILSPYFVVSP